MNFFQLIIIFIVFSILDYLFIKLAIKQNINLFYDLHRDEVIRELNKNEKLKDNEVNDK